MAKAESRHRTSGVKGTHHRQVIGAVVDVAVSTITCRRFLNALETDNGTTGWCSKSRSTWVENTVRTIAMDSTEGLVRGQDVTDTGEADLGAGRRTKPLAAS